MYGRTEGNIEVVEILTSGGAVLRDRSRLTPPPLMTSHLLSITVSFAMT